jgi:hypothetical protein
MMSHRYPRIGTDQIKALFEVYGIFQICEIRVHLWQISYSREC